MRGDELGVNLVNPEVLEARTQKISGDPAGGDAGRVDAAEVWDCRGG